MADPKPFKPGIDDARLAAHAASPQPAWLWSVDGARVLWANAVGAHVLGVESIAALTARAIGPADPSRRQVAQLARRLPSDGATRLERLHGFGAALGRRATCACTRLAFASGETGVLIVALDVAARAMPLADRLRGLVASADVPMAAFATDGAFVGASPAARTLLGFRNLSEAGLDASRDEALASGRSERSVGVGRLVLQRLGGGDAVGLVALLAPTPATGPVVAPPLSDARSETKREDVAPPAPPPAIEEAPSEPTPRSVDGAAEAAGLETVAEAETPACLDPVLPPEPTLSSVPEPPPSPPMASSAGSAPLARYEAPLRFVWESDADTTFRLRSSSFARLLGERIAQEMGQPWSAIASAVAVDAEGRFAEALATRRAFSGVALTWPVEGSDTRLTAHMTGLPLHDGDGRFAGFRGFGVCDDLDALGCAAALRQHDEPAPRPLSANAVRTSPDPIPTLEILQPTDTPVDIPPNVVPFRPAGDARPPALTANENTAFNELARELSARLEGDAQPVSDAPETAPAASEDAFEAVAPWLEPVAPPVTGATARDPVLLDIVPSGTLIYRFDRLLYANPALLDALGYASLQALEDAGGIEALLVEPGASDEASAAGRGTPVTLHSGEATDHRKVAARLHAITWDGDTAHALILSPQPPAVPRQFVEEEPVPEDQPGAANAEDLAAILDTMADGIVLFDGDGQLHACNRSAEALFGQAGDTLVTRNVSELFAPESARALGDALATLKTDGLGSVLDQGRELLGRAADGGFIPLSVVMGRTSHDGTNFFAVFRDLTPAKTRDGELLKARRDAERAVQAKADMLARVSHDIRTPLNAILGFADVMIEEQFGALGNERYGAYLKDIRASGERVLAIVNDLLDLTRIETGRVALSPGPQDLNAVVEHGVAALQPQANRERIIIRSSLGPHLPPVVADPAALRQIAQHLISAAIELARPGGQVIVSTALADGIVALRLRDAGSPMSDDKRAAVLDPSARRGPGEASVDAAPVGLSLAKALADANGARFDIRTAPSGTILEVAFAKTAASV